MDGLRWFVVEAVQGRDFDACLRLARARFDVWRPVDRVRSWNRRGALASNAMRLERKIPRFGRYLFLHCELSDAVVNAVEQLDDVRGFLRPTRDSSPSVVPDAQICFWREHKPTRPKNMPKIRIGQVFDVTEGTFAGHFGAVSDVRDLDRFGIVRLEMNFMGRLTSIPFEVGHIAERVMGQRPPKLAMSA